MNLLKFKNLSTLETTFFLLMDQHFSIRGVLFWTKDILVVEFVDKIMFKLYYA